MRAVLFSAGDVRLGEVDVPDACHVVEFGGAVFARTGVDAMLDGGGLGAAFDQTEIVAVPSLDFMNRKRAAA